jgi:hypothetical protein
MFSNDSGSLCAKCKGRLWCGKDKCPLLVKFYTQTKVKPLIDSTNLEGSSPPSVFIGRWNYPKVFIGPMVPPQHGDTSIMDTPELWTNKSIEEIVDFRFQLVRGKYLTDIKNFEGKIVEKTREIALAEESPETEVEFKSKPAGRIILNDEVQPFGPSASMIKLDVGSYRFDNKVEKAFYDTDLKAKEAVINLYNDKVLVSKIQKAFSVGAFGLGKNRRFVPTRWSITAVDDTLSKDMVEYTKTYPVINEFRVYEHVQLDNRWIILLLPREWCYELIEAWYPNTIWNPVGREVAIFSDHEFYDGRKTYAEIGGCYYAARLATNELLNKERKQAGVVVMREAHPGYIMPVGVWNVREAVRQAVKSKPTNFSSLNETLEYISKRLEIPIKKWISVSNVLKDVIQQRRIIDFLEVKKWK